MSDNDEDKALIDDLAGVGKVINSEVAKWTYKDGVSPSVKQVGALSEDALKTFRLFTAPLQLLAAYQDRFEKFCDRVRERVPESEQCEAAAEIARPVMEAFASTSDGNPIMLMFEELMAKAIDKREAHKLSPQFPDIVKSLSPIEALIISNLSKEEQYSDHILNDKENRIVEYVGSNFDYEEFGGANHHLTIVQNLDSKKLVTILMNQQIPEGTYEGIEISKGLRMNRMVVRLSMFGKWFAESVTPPQ